MIHRFFIFNRIHEECSRAENQNKKVTLKQIQYNAKKKPPKKISQLFTSPHIGIGEYV